MGHILYLYTYNMYSKGAKALARHLLIKRIRHQDSKFKGGLMKTVLNWGATELPKEALKCFVINHPAAVQEVSNKLSFFETVEGMEITPKFTTNKELAMEWASKENKAVVCRQILNGSGGRGIIVAHTPEMVINAPLYTKYVPKKDEYRVHIFQDTVIDVQKKGVTHNKVVDGVNYQIRNHRNGFIYMRDNIEPPYAVEVVALKAFKEFNLHFGAVDVIWTDNTKKALVLEINTAPGLEGATTGIYAEELKGYL